MANEYPISNKCFGLCLTIKIYRLRPYVLTQLNYKILLPKIIPIYDELCKNAVLSKNINMTN